MDRFKSRNLALALLASSALVSPALAVAPRFVAVDKNGVDLVSGRPQFAFDEGGIGSGDGALRMVHTWVTGQGWADNWSGGVDYDGTTASVQLSGISDQFTWNGTTFVSANAQGSTLSLSSGNFIYTSADGTQMTFSNPTWAETTSCPNAGGTCYVPMSIVKPNGMRFDYSWHTFTAAGTVYARLDSVTSSAGYKFTNSYVLPDPAPGTAPASDWWTRSGVTFTNLASPPSPLPTISYSYPAGGGVDVTDAGNRTWHFTEAVGGISAIRRPGSASDNVTYAYSGTLLNKWVSSATVDGVTTTYNRVGSTTTITDALSQQTVVMADTTKQRITSYRDPRPGAPTWTYTYDANARLTRVTAPEGNYTEFTYDSRGNVITTKSVAKTGSGLADIVTSASFDATCTNIVTCNKPNTTTDARLNVTNYSYNPTHGGVTAITRPAPTTGATRPETRFSYTQVTGAAGTSVYELTGSSACQTGAAPSCVGTSDEVKTTISYNSNLLPTSVTRSNGTGTLTATTASTYDSRGRLDTMDGPLSGTADTTKYRWDDADQLIGATDPDPDGAGSMKMRAVRLTYRSDGQVSKRELGTVTDQSNAAWASFATAQQVDIGFDANSRPITSKLSGGGVHKALTQTGYDQLGRVKCTAVRMNIALYGSLPSDACSQALPQGSFGPDQISQIGYDAASEPTQLMVGVGVPADAATERTLTYSNNGLVTSLTDGENNKTTYEYDGFDRLSKIRYPTLTKGSGTSSTTDYEQLTYDANSNVTQYRARSGGLIGFNYDALDRPTSKGSSLLADLTYTYDNLDRLLTAKFATGGQGITNTYDALSRLASSSSDVGGTAHAMSYQYDLASRSTRVAWWDGFYADYDRLVTGETSKVRENGATTGVGVLATYVYDDLRRRTSVTYGNGAAQTFTYDPVSQLASLTDDLIGTSNDLSATFSYSPASQIAQTVRTGDAYAYTAMGNGSTAYSQNGLNQQVTIGGSTATWDNNGNLLTEPQSGMTYTYDLENKLTSATGSPLGSATLSYDPLNRLDTFNPTPSTRFIYDGMEVATELDASGNILNRYVRGDGTDELIVDYSGSGTTGRRFASSDERGSVISLTDSSGAVVAINRYDEYGKPQSGNVGRFQYTGQMWLPNANAYNFKARVYLPHLGIFAQADPIGTVDNPNLYVYARNDPVNLVDPTGLQPCIGPCVIPPGAIVITGQRPRCKADLCFSGNPFGDRPERPQLQVSAKIAEPGSVKPTTPRPNKKPVVYNPRINYCGGEGGTSLPNWVAGVSINDLCYQHDVCYGGSGIPKHQCDQAFGQAIFSRVSARNAATLGSPPFVGLVVGSVAGGTAYLIVTLGGEPYYVPR